jgi:hypothetical protein
MSKNRKPYIFTFDNQNDLITLNESFTMDNNFKILLVNLANVRLNACTNVEIKDESCLDNLDKLYERTEYILGEFRRTGS